MAVKLVSAEQKGRQDGAVFPNVIQYSFLEAFYYATVLLMCMHHISDTNK